MSDKKSISTCIFHLKLEDQGVDGKIVLKCNLIITQMEFEI